MTKAWTTPRGSAREGFVKWVVIGERAEGGDTLFLRQARRSFCRVRSRRRGGGIALYRAR